MNKKSTKTTICIDSAIAERIARYASQHNKARNEIVAAMVEYFAKNGIDPMDAEPPTQAINKLAKRIEDINKMFRGIEKDSLRPMIIECQNMMAKYQTIPDALKKIADYFSNQNVSIKFGICRLYDNDAIEKGNFNKKDYDKLFSNVLQNPGAQR